MQTHIVRHTDDLRWSQSILLLNGKEYKNFTRNNRTDLVDYAVFNHKSARGLWTIKFTRNISLTQLAMMLGLIEYNY